MISSRSAIGQLRRIPRPPKKSPAAIDERHPQVERVADEEIADQRQRDDANADRHEGVPDPQPGDDVDQHEIDRPEGSELARREVSKPANEYSERNEQQQRHERPDIEASRASPCITRSADGKRARDSRNIDRGPGITGVARRQIGREIADKRQRAPQDQYQAGEIVDPRLANALGDGFDIRQGGGGLLGINARHELNPAVATPSAMTDIAAGLLTMPM